MERSEAVRLAFPAGWNPEELQAEWGSRLALHSAATLQVTLWDTFEWGIWFGECVLFSEKGTYHLCRHDGGWIGEEICREKVRGKPRLPSDFSS